MSDPRTIKLAQTLVHYCTGVRPGDWVLIRSHVLGLPLAESVLEYVTKAGGNATIQLHSEEMDEAFLRHANKTQLGWVSPLDEIMADTLDVRINISAASNTRALSGIDPKQQQLAQNARRKLSQTFMRRSAEGNHRWVGVNYPCLAYAQEADMSLREYEDFLYAATYADQPDPVACWLNVHTMQQRLIDWLKGKKQVIIKGPHIDLTLSISGRTFINSDGKRNMPSGEIFTGPVEDSVNGWVRFHYPAIRAGREVEGVEFEFRNGKVVNALAKKNEPFLISQLDSDEGSRFLGEFAFGANYQIQRFSKNILFDEKIGGTIHMAVGAGYPETGSRNQSSVHWDFICDMREESDVWVDGELFYRNGQFAI